MENMKSLELIDALRSKLKLDAIRFAAEAENATSVERLEASKSRLDAVENCLLELDDATRIAPGDCSLEIAEFVCGELRIFISYEHGPHFAKKTYIAQVAARRDNRQVLIYSTRI